MPRFVYAFAAALLLAAPLLAPTSLHAQCTPDATVDLGLDPDSLPDGTVGVAYPDQCVTFAVAGRVDTVLDIAFPNPSPIGPDTIELQVPIYGRIGGFFVDSVSNGPDGLAVDTICPTGCNVSLDSTSTASRGRVAFSVTGTPTTAELKFAGMYVKLLGRIYTDSIPVLPGIFTLEPININLAGNIDSVTLPDTLYSLADSATVDSLVSTAFRLILPALGLDPSGADSAQLANFIWPTGDAINVENVSAAADALPAGIRSLYAANGQLNVELTQPATFGYRVLDNQGRVLANLPAQPTAPGLQRYSLCSNCLQLAAGIYHVQGQLNGTPFVRTVWVR